jgi:undecaprenyl-diphosphatase
MSAIYHMTYLQAIVIGLIQGLTELFPISSLGHTVLVPSWFGGSWATLVSQESRSESPYLAFVVGLHLSTALVLIAFYWREWVRVVRGLVTSIATRRVESDEQRLAWLLVIATIPVGIAGLALEHTFRVLFAKPVAAAIFLTINGGILFLGERYRRRARVEVVPADPARVPAELAGSAAVPGPSVSQAGDAGGTDAGGTDAGGTDAGGTAVDLAAQQRLAGIGMGSALWIGAAQILALFAGISREGVTMAGGLIRGLSHEDALRFSFLLSTPVILAAGALKIPDLIGPLGAGIRGQVIAGSVAAAATSVFAVVFLARYFRTRTLTPFAIYCAAAGLISIVRFGLF